MRRRSLPTEPPSTPDEPPMVWSVEIDGRERLCLGTKVSVPSKPGTYRVKMVELPEELR